VDKYLKDVYNEAADYAIFQESPQKKLPETGKGL
jgi:hypothetical protein